MRCEGETKKRSKAREAEATAEGAEWREQKKNKKRSNQCAFNTT